jgi:hypothetical protein
MLKEQKTTLLTRRRRNIVLVLAAVTISVAAGYYTPRTYDAVTMGKSASSVAKQLKCTGFKQEPSHTTMYAYHDAGNCRFGGTTVRITTFDRGSDRSAYDQTFRIVEANNSKAKGGEYASGAGWHVVDANGFKPTVAQAVVNKLGGSTHAIPTITRKASPSPSASARPSP